jgi:hypothetical protein
LRREPRRDADHPSHEGPRTRSMARHLDESASAGVKRLSMHVRQRALSIPSSEPNPTSRTSPTRRCTSTASSAG